MSDYIGYLAITRIDPPQAVYQCEFDPHNGAPLLYFDEKGILFVGSSPAISAKGGLKLQITLAPPRKRGAA